MAPESGFETTAAQQGPWAAASHSASGGLAGGADAGAFMPWLSGGGAAGSAAGAAPWLNPSTSLGGAFADGAAHGGAQGQEKTVNPDQHSVPAVKDAVKSAMGGPGKAPAEQQEAILSPEKLDAQFKEGKGGDYTRAKELGLNAEQYKQQYVHEYMARLSQTDPFVSGADGKPAMGKDGKPVSNYSAAQQNSLTAWGYNAKVDPSNVVDDNKKTGLFAIRFEPSAAGAKNGRAPVVAFRGTEPDRGPKDAQTDLADEYIGKSQYEPNKAAIAGLFGRKPGEKDDVVGYSLGGALAQRSLVDNGDNVRALSTFQSPGIKGTDAAKVNAAIANNGIDANHHFFTNDIVHRAGEAKANGNYHEYTRSDWAAGVDTGTAHTSSFLIPSDGGKGTLDAHGQVKKDNGYQAATDPTADHSTKIQNYQNDRQADRGFWEKQRRTLGPSAGGLLGEIQSGMNLWQKTDGEFNAVKGPDGKPIPGALQNSVNQVKGGWQGAKQGVGEVKQGAGEVGHGFNDLLHGRFSQGFSEIGHGVQDGVQGAKDTGGGISNMWNGAKSGVSTVKNFWHDHVAPHGGDIKNIVTGLPGILGHLAHDPTVQKKYPIVGKMANAYDTVKDVGTGISNGFHNAVDATKQTAHNVGTGISSGFHSAVDATKGAVQTVGTGISNGFHGAVDATKNTAKNIGNGISNGVHSLANKAKHLWPF